MGTNGRVWPLSDIAPKMRCGLIVRLLVPSMVMLSGPGRSIIYAESGNRPAVSSYRVFHQNGTIARKEKEEEDNKGEALGAVDVPPFSRDRTRRCEAVHPHVVA